METVHAGIQRVECHGFRQLVQAAAQVDDNVAVDGCVYRANGQPCAVERLKRFTFRAWIPVVS
jgi:hypothetical protein